MDLFLSAFVAATLSSLSMQESPNRLRDDGRETAGMKSVEQLSCRILGGAQQKIKKTMIQTKKKNI
jgi:hypothetical protein